MKTLRKMIHRDKNHQRGFTLIELLIVIGILGVLAAIMIPALGAFRHSGKAEAWESDQNTLQTCVAAYFADHGVYYPTTTGKGDDPETTDTNEGIIVFRGDVIVGEDIDGTGPIADGSEGLVNLGYLTEAPKSASSDNPGCRDTPGTYTWYVDANGAVKSAPTFEENDPPLYP
jgi:prepilin-type N-terminal cleavage/methylation domain-containing protein